MLEAASGEKSPILLYSIWSCADPPRIGYGAAQAFVEAGAHVVILSSSQENVDNAVKQLNSPNVQGQVADARDEEGFTAALQSLAPLDHLVFSGVDKIIRGSVAEVNLDEAKNLFGVKFWGSVIAGKGEPAQTAP